MRLYAFLTLATCALVARAASVPKLDVSDLQKKLAAVAQQAAKKEILPIDAPDAEKVSVNEVQNDIKYTKIPGIPVKVVVDDAKPPVTVDRLDDIEMDDGADIKRVPIDLKNPGAPQLQKHETQNPEHFEEPADNMKQTVADAHTNVQQGLQDVSDDLQDWFSDNDQVNVMEQSIKELQDNFKGQLSKLNQTVQSFLPHASNPAYPTEQKAFETIDGTLKTLEATFQKTIDRMSEGVKAYALFVPSLRQAAETGTTASPTGGDSNNIFLQYLQTLQNTISQGFANVTASIQNAINSNGGADGNNTFPGPGGFISGIGSGIQNIFTQQSTTVAATQADESGTTARPGWPIWQGIQSSLQNILNPGQNQAGGQVSQDQPATPGPIVQAIQNNPLVQAVGNFIQPNRPGAQQPATPAPAKPDAQPAEAGQSADSQPADSTQEGSNAVPASDVKPQRTEEKIPEEGPIKKIIQNNPIMKGISGAVQKIQSLGNPEKPRDALEGASPDDKKKGGLPFYSHGHPGNNHSGDNNDVNSSGQIAKSEPAKEAPATLPEVPKEDKNKEESVQKSTQK